MFWDGRAWGQLEIQCRSMSIQLMLQFENYLQLASLWLYFVAAMKHGTAVTRGPSRPHIQDRKRLESCCTSNNASASWQGPNTNLVEFFGKPA